MGFKTKPKYKLVRENYAGKDFIQSKDEVEITSEQILDLTYGLIPHQVFKAIIEWLKEDSKHNG